MGKQTEPDASPESQSVAEGPSADEVFADAARSFLEAQVRAVDTLDGRVATAFSVASTVLPLTIGLLNLQGGQLSVSTKLLLGGALAVYLGLTVCAYLAFRQGRLSYRPNIPELEQLSREYEGVSLRRWVAEGQTRSIEQNTKLIDSKTAYARLVFRGLYGEAILLSLAALIAVL